MIGLSVNEALEILRRLMVAMPRNYELHRAIENKDEGWIISFMEPHFSNFQAVLLTEALLSTSAIYSVSSNIVKIFKSDVR